MRVPWKRARSSLERGTADVAAPSESEMVRTRDSDPDVEWKAEMTAVDSEPLAADSLDRALADRAMLIQLCVYALDRASSGVVERLSEGLGGIGVAAVQPDGDRFDPAWHEAGGTVDTDDPALDGLIAETEMLGFADRDRVVRLPIVTVYQLR